MEDLKQAVIASQAEDAALGTLYSRYYTAMRYRTPTGPAIRAEGAKDRGEAQAALQLAGGVGLYKAGDFIEGIVYDTVLSLVVYHVHATQGVKAPQTYLDDERTALINSIRRDYVTLNENMTVISEQSIPELLAYIASMSKKLHFLREMVMPTASVPPIAKPGDLGYTPTSLQATEREVTVLMKDGRPIAVLDKDSFDGFPKPDRFEYMTEWQAVSDDSEVTKLYVGMVPTGKDMILPELRKAAIDWLMLASINKQVTRPALEELSDAEVLAECQSLLAYWDRVKKTQHP